MPISKTDFIRALQCEKMLWLDAHADRLFDPGRAQGHSSGVHRRISGKAISKKRRTRDAGVLRFGFMGSWGR